MLRTAAAEARVEELPDGTATAREAARAIGCDLSQVVKSILLVCDGAYVLALVPGDRRADERAVAEALDASDVRVARPGEVVHATGFEPGSVAPFPARAVTQTLLDRSLLAHLLVWIGAGSPTHMAVLPPLELQRLTRARAVDLAS